MYDGTQDQYPIQHILNLMDLFSSEHAPPGGTADREDLLSPADRQERYAAHAIMHFMDEMPGGFLIYHAGGGEEILYANRALMQIFRCETVEQFQELTGGSFRGIVHPDDLEAVEQSIAEQIAASQYDLDYVEYRIVCRDGSIRWIEDYGHFVHGNGSPDIFYVFMGDATEKRDRLLAEQALQMEEVRKSGQRAAGSGEDQADIDQEYMRRIEVIRGLSVNYESIFYADLDTDMILPYQLSSRSGPLFEGKLQARSLSRTIADYIALWVCPEDQALCTQVVAPSYIREKLAVSDSFYVNYRAVGETEPQFLQLRIVGVRQQEQISKFIMGVRRVDDEIHNETEQKQMLAEALNNANQAITAKNTFLSNMSHDMRTPLNAILGYTALAMRDRQDPDAVQGHLQRIEASSKQLLDLISKVLELSSSAGGTSQVTEVECDLCQILEDIYDFLLPQAQEKDIDFTLDCAGVAHREICGDEEKLRQLVLYLVNNAVTYTQSGGRVSITARELELLPSQYAVYQLVVSDNGIGISQEFQAQIFEPFSRAQNTTLSGIHGIGLGLTIAKNIVDLLGGRIEVDSAVGKGSTFTITLRFQVKPLPFSSTAPSPRTASLKGMCILLVEDNAINLAIESEILQGAGFLIETADNGKIALEMVAQAPPDRYGLILMDIQMPVMDGWEATEAIRCLPDQARAGIPIVGLSANCLAPDVHRSIASGMDAHIPKPLDMDQLTRTIREVLDKRAQNG